MKKAIYMFVLGILFLASSGLASAAWNTYPSDCPNSLSIGNYTTGEGIQDGSNGCWSKKSVSASAGQTINVAVYYDNTNNADANNTVISLTQSPTGSMSSKNSSYTFSGSLTSSAGSLYLSPVSVNLSSSETLTFSQAKWFKKGAQTGIALPGGQTGSSAFTGGLSLANITNGDWGTVLFSFSVGTTLAPQTCQDSTANNFGSTGACDYAPQYLSYTINATAGTGGTISPAGITSYTYPDNSKWFTITPSAGYHALDVLVDGVSVGPSYGGYGFYFISKNHTIHATFAADQVITKDCIATLSASRTPIIAGESSTLTWTLADCTKAELWPTVGLIYSSNSQNVYPTSSMLYTLTASGANGTVTKTVTINVNAPTPTTCQNPLANNIGGALPCTFTQKYDTYKITATAGTGGSISPSGVTSYTYPNNSKFYAVTANSGYTTKEILVDGFPQPLVGGYAFYNISANHTISASFAQTQVAKSCSATLFASNISITKGESSTLTWTLADCTKAELWPTVGLIYSSNSQNVYPTSSTLYTLTAYNSNGTSITRTVTINVNTPTPPTICQDYNANNYGLTGVCTYTKVANTILNLISSTNNSVNNSNNNNSVNNSNNTTNTTNTTTNTIQTPIQQICQDHSANNYLSYGSCIYTNYNRTRCLDTSASNYLEYNSCIYNQVRCLDTTASNYLAYNACVYNTYVNKNVVTTVATNITKNEAQINGYITNTTYYNANVYFNYGTTVNLGSRTNSKVASGNSYFNDYLTGLAPNTIYFFQAVGESNTGTSKGSIEVFRTLGEAAVAKQIIVQGTTIVGKASPVLLNISNKYQLIGAGDTVDYIVTYKNIGNTRLVRPMVQVVIPMNMTLINSSRGTYSVDTHTLSAPVEDLNPGQEGVIYLQARVDSIPLNNSQIVTTALLVYTNTNGAQENAMAYVFNEPSAVSGSVLGDSSTLGASAFFGGFLSIGLIGWLLILLLVLIIILISRSYSRTSSDTVTHTTTTH